MYKIYNLSIVLSFFGLWVTSLFPGELEVVLGFIFIFSFGILHGSNDILLINSMSNPKTRFPMFRVLFTYIIIVLAAVVVFYFLPLLGLILFVLFSAFHFGEQHWEHRTLSISKGLKQLLYILYGLFVLQLLFVLNPDDVIEVVQSISGYILEESLILYSFISNSIALLVLIIILLLKSEVFKNSLIKELLYLMVFTIIFKVSTLIWGFTIYFILWHSVPSLYEQVGFIYGTFNKKNVLNYCKKALPYWIISLVSIALVYVLFKERAMFYALFFSFIAAVTFPHALVINKMFSHKT
ncbi:Brp/Blh family beta-carotene 15,15'-dioxygenase [uncultured Psychroserpens sp.]|uniref:Brp/Blh family beta-carotene 15,15'-dioxygenase n=1 Tax=uncultured Psychroserpens sp. TaxID=255436 RepID=UPI00262581B4|nr:Brp/Blh family beta-carotene 15,15'-dioxygenase [uncultured Psychroserpens sp.]